MYPVVLTPIYTQSISFSVAVSSVTLIDFLFMFTTMFISSLAKVYVLVWLMMQGLKRKPTLWVGWLV